MWVALVPSGMDWLDAEIGGVPAAGVVTALGSAGSGKTSLALGFALSQLKRNTRVCYLTTETPEAVLETCRGMLELDLRPFIAQGTLTLLSFAPFFVNKVRSLNSVDPPLAELKELFDERSIQHVVFDTLDPMLTWIEGANAKAGVRQLLGQIQSWGRAVLCTMSGTAPAVAELARTASGSLELGDGKVIVRQAGWCNVYDIEAPLHFVQGRGLVVRANAGRKPAGKAPYMSDMSLIAASPAAPDSEPRPNAMGAQSPWTSLIGDASKFVGPQAHIIASNEIFAPQMTVGLPQPPTHSPGPRHGSVPPARMHPASSAPVQASSPPYPSSGSQPYPSALDSGSHPSMATGPHPQVVPPLTTGPHPQVNPHAGQPMNHQRPYPSTPPAPVMAGQGYGSQRPPPPRQHSSQSGRPPAPDAKERD